MSSEETPTPFIRIAVFGPGLLGGSIVRAVSKRLPNAAVQVWGRREEPLEILRKEVSVASTDPGEAAAEADLVILATPVGVMRPVANSILASGHLKPGCVVTDVGSVKAPVVAELESRVAEAGGHFVGSHPMAGSEKSGLDHATADLFEGAACLVTPTAASDSNSVGSVEGFWAALGCRVSRLSPEDHDRAVAGISHLPHVVAAVLVEAVLAENPSLGEFAGGGFRDTTRIAAGAPKLWTEILLENREAVVEALHQFQSKIGETLAFFDDERKEDLRQFLSDAKKRRENLGGPSKST